MDLEKSNFSGNKFMSGLTTSWIAYYRKRRNSTTVQKKIKN